ncbi:hypothetical protein FOCC_FOCC013185 [Frankliniella occidentalis]|nr:hypothetical protein FOCC_FOCC013185 [Frankliniella occidentalis]
MSCCLGVDVDVNVDKNINTRLGVQLSARTRVIQSITHQYLIPRAGSISVGVTSPELPMQSNDVIPQLHRKLSEKSDRQPTDEPEALRRLIVQQIVNKREIVSKIDRRQLSCCLGVDVDVNVDKNINTRLGVQLSARTRVIQSITHQYLIPRAGSISVGVTRFCCDWK